MKRRWTNATIRQKLGECGFIETNITPIADKQDASGSVWERNGYLVVLWTHVYKEPELTDYHTLASLDVDDLGVRNINIGGITRP